MTIRPPSRPSWPSYRRRHRAGRVTLAATALAVFMASLGAAPALAQQASPTALAEWWDTAHVSPPYPQLVSHEEVVRRLAAARDGAPDLFSLEEIGRSVEGRSIHHLWFGKGDFHVLLWSQMHGNEPTATTALFDVIEYVSRHRSGETVRRMLDDLTVHIVPMLNPDGAARWQRANAQGIDVNRDALRLTTPEGRVLKDLRDRIEPQVGFNLHNQGWRTSVGDPPRPASISLLAVAYDKELSENEGRLRTKRLCALIADALEAFAPGQIGRYDETFNPRAFGDNITAWGTPVVLIETGAWPARPRESPLVRLNFVALMTSLDALATGKVDQADKTRYEQLPENQSQVLAILLRGVTIVNGTGIPAFVSDVGIGGNRRVRTAGGENLLQEALTIDDIGDLSFMGAFEVIDGKGLTVAPAFGTDPKVGEVVRLPDWKDKPSERTVMGGQPADLFLLEPSGEAGNYRIERIIRSVQVVGSVPAPKSEGPRSSR